MRFVVLGDLHYSLYKTPELRQICKEYYQNLFNSVLEQNAEVVFAIGDTVDNGNAEEFEELHACARQVGLKFLTVNGNHDLLQLTKTEIAQWTGNQNPYYSMSYNPISGLSNTLDTDASRFVVMDTPKEKSPKDHGGYVRPEQLSWLKTQIDQSGEQPLFVFGHHPVQNATLYSTFPMLNIDNSKEVKVAFLHKRQGVGFYFCGHNHANSISRKANWNFIQTAAPLRTNDFRVIDYTPEEVLIQTVEVKIKQQRKLAGKMMKAMGDFLQLPARGFRSDRQLRVQTGSDKVVGGELSVVGGK